MKKEILRAAARLALARRYSEVKLGRAQGVIPGARLEYSDGGVKKEAAVRTSNEREVGLLRDRKGVWRTLSKVQLVLIAVPSEAEDEVAEVLAFDPVQLQAEFDDVVKATEKGNRSASRFKAPVFLPLDPSSKKRTKGLRLISQWIEKIAEADVPDPIDGSSDREAAIDKIRAGIAKGLGVEASRVELTFSFKILP